MIALIGIWLLWNSNALDVPQLLSKPLKIAKWRSRTAAKADFKARSKKLSQAWTPTKEALAA